MNFYISDTVSNIDLDAANVEFSDDLLEYIYNLKSKISFNVEKLIGIDPYSDVVISEDGVRIIVDICDYLIGTLLFENYDNHDEAMAVLGQLRELGKLAIANGMGLISIGD